MKRFNVNSMYKRVITNKVLGFALLIGFYSSFFEEVAQSSLTEDTDFSVEPVTAQLVGDKDQSERGEAQSLVNSDSRMDQFRSEANQLFGTLDTLDNQLTAALQKERLKFLPDFDDLIEDCKKLICRVLDHNLVGQPPITWKMVPGILRAHDRMTYGVNDEDVLFVNEILPVLLYCNDIIDILYMCLADTLQGEYLVRIKKDKDAFIEIKDAISKM